MRTTTWIGRTSDRAYIEVWHGGPWWLGGGIDVTSAATIPAGHRSALDLVARAPGVVAGLAVAATVIERSGDTEVQLLAHDGESVARGDVLLSAVGPTADLLTQRLTVHEQTAWMLRSLLEE